MVKNHSIVDSSNRENMFQINNQLAVRKPNVPSFKTAHEDKIGFSHALVKPATQVFDSFKTPIRTTTNQSYISQQANVADIQIKK